MLKFHEGELALLLKSEGGPTGRFMATLAAKVETAAKARCPVKTGRLRSSINHRVETSGKGIVAIIGTNVEYAIYVHEGTRYMTGRPFLVDGLHAVAGSRG
jgi:HK97 gp10 family phage protein